jgi:heat shock protein HslJ
MTFNTNERIIVSAARNMITGGVQLDGDRMIASDLGSTEMGCDSPRHEQDHWLARLVGASSGVDCRQPRYEETYRDTAGGRVPIQ